MGCLMSPNAVKAFEVIDLNRLGVKIKFAAFCRLPKSLQSIPQLMVLSQDPDLLEATINKHFIDAGCLIESLRTVFSSFTSSTVSFVSSSASFFTSAMIVSFGEISDLRLTSSDCDTDNDSLIQCSLLMYCKLLIC